MVSYLRLMSAEGLKYRRTAVKWLVLCVPALYSFLVFVATGLSGDRMVRGDLSQWQWMGYTFGTVWLAFVLPIGAVVLAGLACHQMQSDSMWRATLLQPVERGSVYLAHLSGVVLLALLGSLIYAAGLLVTGAVFLHAPVDWRVVFSAPLGGLVAALPILAIQVWLGARIRNIAIPMAIGMGGFIGGLVARQLGIGMFWPWSYPILYMHPSALILFLAAVLFGLLAVVGAVSFVKTDTL